MRHKTSGLQPYHPQNSRRSGEPVFKLQRRLAGVFLEHRAEIAGIVVTDAERRFRDVVFRQQLFRLFNPQKDPSRPPGRAASWRCRAT